MITFNSQKVPGDRRLKLIIALLLVAFALSGAQPIPVIFDTDAGNDIDDAFALAFLLQSPELDVRAVVTSRFESETRARLVWKILRVYGREDIPLASGGTDGLLNFQERRPTPQFRVLTANDTLPKNAVGRGVQLLIETLLNSSEKITLVPVGPLTNIALALKADPRIKTKIERIVLMGGAFEANRIETNIVNDPVAAAIVFESGLPVVAVGSDVTRQVPLKPADVEQIRKVAHPATNLLMELLDQWHTWRVGMDPVLHDALAVAVIFRPELCSFADGLVAVETAGTYTRGMTRFTPHDALPKDALATTKVARTVDAPGFIELFLRRVAAPPRARR